MSGAFRTSGLPFVNILNLWMFLEHCWSKKVEDIAIFVVGSLYDLIELPRPSRLLQPVPTRPDITRMSISVAY